MASGGGRYEEHQFRRLIPGDLEASRKGICDVLEDFGYAVLGDNPIQGKRRRQKNFWNATILECQTQLTIALKPISDVSTLATFDYGVEYLFTKGDRQTLEREADAIIAMATTPSNRMVCPSCSTENNGAVRFCRVCGTPLARHDSPPELEVMRMSAGASSSHLELVVGLVVQILALAASVPMILFGPTEIVRLGWGLFVFGQILSWLALSRGIYRLYHTVNPAGAGPTGRLESPPTLSIEDRMSLLPRPHSVTEGTTELIVAAEPSISTKPSRNTDSI
ncbi:MAG: hypothetical protein WAV20_00645 [Blastocatellia bacterium]